MYTSYEHAYVFHIYERAFRTTDTRIINEHLTNTNIVWVSYKSTHIIIEYRHSVCSYLFIRFGQSCLHYTYNILVRCFHTKELFGCSTNTMTLFV